MDIWAWYGSGIISIFTYILTSYVIGICLIIVVWSFLRGCKLPYCVLYDRGYTSIGNVNDTVQNEALLANENEHYQNGETKQYKPAYELECEELERSNRLVKGKQYVESS